MSKLRAARTLFKEIIERDKLRHTFLSEPCMSQNEIRRYVKSIRHSQRDWFEEINDRPESIEPVDVPTQVYVYDDYQQSQDDFLLMQEPDRVPDSPSSPQLPSLSNMEEDDEVIPATPPQQIRKNVWFREHMTGYMFKQKTPPKELGQHFVQAANLEDGDSRRSSLPKKRTILLRNGKTVEK